MLIHRKPSTNLSSCVNRFSGSLLVWGPPGRGHVIHWLFKWPHLCFQSRHWTTCCLSPCSPLLPRSSPLPQQNSPFLFTLSSCLVSSLFSQWQRLQLTRRLRQQLALRVCSSLARFINHRSVTPGTVLSTVSNVWIFTVFLWRLLINRNGVWL